jgi:hypothetical protein
MLYKVFSVYDHKAELFSQPFISPKTGSAVRGFSTGANDPSHDFSKFPDDFELFEIGDWDDGEGQFIQYEIKQSQGRASKFVVAK